MAKSVDILGKKFTFSNEHYWHRFMSGDSARNFDSRVNLNTHGEVRGTVSGSWLGYTPNQVNTIGVTLSQNDMVR